MRRVAWLTHLLAGVLRRCHWRRCRPPSEDSMQSHESIATPATSPVVDAPSANDDREPFDTVPERAAALAGWLGMAPSAAAPGNFR